MKKLLKMMKIKIFFLIYAFALSLNVQSQVFENIRLGESLDQVKNKIEHVSDSIKLIKINPPVFPLSKNHEVHLIAFNVKLKTDSVEKVVLTFSDDKLTYVECKGNIQALLRDREEDPLNYLNYQVYTKNLLFIDADQDAAWFLTQESVHPNLFTWNNPLLENKELIRYEPSAKLPKFISMGDDLVSLESLFEEESKILQKDTLDGSDPNAQIQLNAFGIEYAGFPRKFEARFGDGKLHRLWILTAKGEEDRIRQKLIAEFGQPLFLNEQWEFFKDWSVALRKDNPEVLFLSKKLALGYKNDLSK